MSYTCLQYHIVFATKERRRSLDDQIMPRLMRYIGGIVRGPGGTMLDGNGTENHVHLAMVLPARLAVADAVREIKSCSSGWVRQELPGMRIFSRQDGYSAFSVSQSVMPSVLEYIRRQKEHHREMSYEEEVARMLQQHEIVFDRQFI